MTAVTLTKANLGRAMARLGLLIISGPKTAQADWAMTSGTPREAWLLVRGPLWAGTGVVTAIALAVDFLIQKAIPADLPGPVFLVLTGLVLAPVSCLGVALVSSLIHVGRASGDVTLADLTRKGPYPGFELFQPSRFLLTESRTPDIAS